MNNELILQRLEEKLKEIEEEFDVKMDVVTQLTGLTTTYSLEVKPSDNYKIELRSSKRLNGQ